MLQLYQDCMFIILPGLGVQFAVLSGEQFCLCQPVWDAPPPHTHTDTQMFACIVSIVSVVGLKVVR